jgi:LPS-assembly protein
MIRFSAIALLAFLVVAWPFVSWAQLPGILSEKQPGGFFEKSQSEVIPGAPSTSFGYDFATGTEDFTYVIVGDTNTTLMADKVSYNAQTGIATADGHVIVEQSGMMWVGNHVRYNSKTHLIESGAFRAGKLPVYAQGDWEQANLTNKTYTATNIYVTSDNIAKPDYYVKASRMTVVPGKYIEAWNAVLYVKGVPIFYYPYYRRNLGLHANTFTAQPGDDSTFGPFVLGTYSWWLNDNADGKIHLDYRGLRGVGVGPDLNLHLDRWGEAQFKYYYLYDQDPNKSIENNTNYQDFGPIPHNRQRFYMGWQATPSTNLNLKAMVNYQSDQLVLHDFFQGDYAENPQPNTFVEGNKYWDNWSLDALTTPRINSFFDQVERLPDVQLNGLRQQVLTTPVYYESQSSAGYYQRYFAATNTLFGAPSNTPAAFNAPRLDTFQQLLLPQTFFGWLNVTPRVGGRVTWYGPETGPAGTNAVATRYVLNTGLDTSFTLSQLWPDATNGLFDVDGLRHIIVPSLSYAFIPQPNVAAPNLPQFDTLLSSLMVLPIEFPDYNDIDAIERQNVIRFGIRNTLQTRRDGQLDNLLDWNLMLDWNLNPNGQTNSVFLQPQKTFDDLYSDLIFKPRSWITFQSQMRYDINDAHLNLSFNQIALTPNDRWSLGVGHWYLRNGFVDAGANIISGSLYYRLNENWGLHAMEYFNAQNGRLQEQYYGVYRDMRSWTVALTFRVINNTGGQPVDFGFAFSISLKASPGYHVGSDTVRPYELIGQ